jgi:drug/metabolite transporter (DMT)-like permease
MSERRARACSYAIAFTSVAFGTLGQVLLKSGTGPAGAPGLIETLSRALSTPLVWAGLATYAFSSVLWLVALSRLELSAAYPLGASGYVIVVAASVLMGEAVPLWRWIGVAVIVTGILAVSLGRSAPAARGGSDR